MSAQAGAGHHAPANAKLPAATLVASLFRAGAGGVPSLVPMLSQIGFGCGAIGAFAMKPPLTLPI